MRKQIFFVLGILFLMSFISAASFSNPSSSSFGNVNTVQYSNPSINQLYSSSEISTYWPQLAQNIQNDQCENSQDFLVMIPPAGCSPMVVRSDLLAEQNVPVICQLISAKVNPLIDVSNIKSISFQGKYPNDVSAVSYYPARAALRSNKVLLGSPVVNNIGYVTIVLKRTQNESAMAKNVSGNLTATISYDAQKAFGVGAAEFYLETVNDADWAYDYEASSFWNGRGFLRLIDVQGDTARVAIYSDQNRILNELTLKEGQTSNRIYFPGFYCQAGLRVKLNTITSDADSAILDIDGDKIAVRQNSQIINGRCRVTSLVMGDAGAGKVELRCNGVNKNIVLSLLSGQQANISVNGAQRIVGVGEEVVQGAISKTNYNWKLAYIGNTRKQITGIETQTPFIVLVGESDVGRVVNPAVYGNIEVGIKSIFDKVDTITQADFEKQVATASNYYVGGQNLLVIYQNGQNDQLKLLFNGIVSKDSDSSVVINNANSELVGQYYRKAGESLNQLLDNYPTVSESDSNKSLSFGEQALLSYKILSNNLVPFGIATSSDVMDLLNKFLSLYPGSSIYGEINSELGSGSRYDISNAVQTVYVDNDYHTIALTQMKPADSSSKSAELNVNGLYYGTVHENERVNLSGGQNPDYLYVKKIVRSGSVNVVEFNLYKYSSTKGNYNLQSTMSVRDDSTNQPITTSSSAGEYTIKVNNVQIKEVASISLIPEMPTKTSANFTYNIGIEKRNIKISPEKANETANKLNETIRKWEEKNAKLGKLVESWKGACLATSAVLQIKTLLQGFTGESTARAEVMKTYRDDCKANVSSRTQTSSECYAALSDKIDSDVEIYSTAIKSINEDKVGGIKGKTIDQWKASMNNASIDYSNNNYPGVQITTGNLNSWEDVKAYLLNEKIKNSAATAQLKSNVLTSRDIRLVEIARYKYSQKQSVDATANLVARGISNANVVSIDSSDSIPKVWGRQKVSDMGGLAKLDSPIGITEITPIQFVNYLGKEYLAILTVSTQHTYGVESVWYWDSAVSKYKNIAPNRVLAVGSTDQKAYSDITRLQFSTSSQGVCSNKYASIDNIKVEYYESGSVKGMPAKVPFDALKGWYIRVSDSQGGMLSDSQKGYQANGAISYYKICNIGGDNLENSNDECQGFDINTEAQVSSFSGCAMSSTDVQKLIRDAKEAIRQAQNQYGKSKVVISVGGRGEIVMTGTIATSDNGLECENFMSPEDCNIMYNVCDPVICPASRCDFGGKYPVANVIQSGVFGSLFLCLPNFGSPSDGKVIVPICLTGVHAGIEGWISILKAEQKCMQTAAKTGQYTGICDEMTAVYKCEFFWRQAQPLMDNLVPRLAEGLYSGFSSTKKGGGEYLTFQNAWDNMQKSISFFKNTYASTSFTAVKFGNVAEVGSAFCKGFVGTSIPTSAKAVDGLLKPESPTQFYAQFSEISLTDATAPPTSQYKVYYHIYSGKDQGVSYQIYLKNPPASSYYSTIQQIVVDTGYVSPDQNVDQAKDFSAPAGYKELCVVINGQDNCGFKQVTSDFGLNLLHDTYATSQATANATSEKTCVSGTASVLGLANLNIQAGVEEATQPSINLRGVVRVCATNNPGTGIETNRWLSVGSCGNGMTCWLDNDSLNSNTLEVMRNTVDLSNAQKALDDGTRMLNGSDSANILTIQVGKIKTLVFDDTDKSSQSKIEEKINPILDNLTNVENNAAEDKYKSQAMYLKFELYSKVVKELSKKATVINGVVADKKTQDTTTSTTGSVSSEEEIIVLAKMMQGEEGNQGNVAMEAVGSVAMNRLLYARANNDARAFGGTTLSAIIVAQNQFQGYNSSNNYSSSEQIAGEVYSSISKQYEGYYYFGNVVPALDVHAKMVVCKLKNPNFKWMQVGTSTLYLSNGDYTSSTCKIPANAVPII